MTKKIDNPDVWTPNIWLRELVCRGASAALCMAAWAGLVLAIYPRFMQSLAQGNGPEAALFALTFLLSVFGLGNVAATIAVRLRRFWPLAG